MMIVTFTAGQAGAVEALLQYELERTNHDEGCECCRDYAEALQAIADAEHRRDA